MKCIPILAQKKIHVDLDAVDRKRKKFINFTIGNRKAETGKLLYKSVRTSKKAIVATDHWKAYKTIIPSKFHVTSKAETYTLEGYNSLFRHFLTRLRRKSKCYNKCLKMLEYSVNLLILKRNNQLSILN